MTSKIVYAVLLLIAGYLLAEAFMAGVYIASLINLITIILCLAGLDRN